MRWPIDLYGQFQFRTIEIQSILAHAMLTPEFETKELTVFQLCPQQLFRSRRVISQFLAEWLLGFVIEFVHLPFQFAA